MNNLLILNVNKDISNRYSQIEKRTYPTTYIFGNNGLPEEERVAFNKVIYKNRTYFLFDTVQKEDDGWFGNMLFTIALNRADTTYLSYVDCECSGDTLDKHIHILETNPNLMAVGSAAKFIPEDLATQQYIQSDGRTSCIATPWTMRFQSFSQLSRNIAAFNQIAQGFNKTFQKDVRFEYLFSSIYAALRNTTKDPILSVA